METARPRDCFSWDGSMLRALFKAGALSVINNREALDKAERHAGAALSRSVAAGREELDANPSQSASVVAETFSRGCNRGLPTHQVRPFTAWIRGFAGGVGDRQKINAHDFAEAIVAAALVGTHHSERRMRLLEAEPIVGELWSVAKVTAEDAKRTASGTADICYVLEQAAGGARESVSRTPFVHVAGGLALYNFLHGMELYLR